jgi:hypothetical protein
MADSPTGRFEVERVAGGTYIAKAHPEFVLGAGAGGLLDLGNPQVWISRRRVCHHMLIFI